VHQTFNRNFVGVQKKHGAHSLSKMNDHRIIPYRPDYQLMKEGETGRQYRKNSSIGAYPAYVLYNIYNVLKSTIDIYR
jgi:hypothetical protein